MDYSVNGALWGDQDLETALPYEAFLGIEAFNTREVRYSTNETDPWADFDAGVSSDHPYPSELLAGLAAWDGLLRTCLLASPAGGRWTPARKVFLAGGSDAHGDFNYSTYLALDSYATDNAIGKVQTVAQSRELHGPGNLPRRRRSSKPCASAGRLSPMDLSSRSVSIEMTMGIGTRRAISRSGTAAARIQMRRSPSSFAGHRCRSSGRSRPFACLRGDPRETSLLIGFDPTLSGQGYSGSTRIDLQAYGFDGPVYFRAECLTSDGDAGHRAYTNPIWIDFDPAADLADGGTPGAGRADWSGPNPSDGTIETTFTLTSASTCRFAIYDATGRLVRSIIAARMLPPGTHTIKWDGRDDRGAAVASGVYHGILAIDGVKSVHRLLVIR